MQMFYSATTGGFYCVEIHGSAMPPDVIEIPRDLYDSLVGKQITTGPDGLPALFVPPEVPADPVSVLKTAIQECMDAEANKLTYGDLKAVVSYRGDPNPRFAAEAEAFFVWRSAVWTTAYAYLDRVQAGEVPFPSLDEAIAMMPALVINYP